MSHQSDPWIYRDETLTTCALIPSRGLSYRPCPVSSHALQRDSGYLGVAAGERGAANPRVPCGWGCGKLVATGHHKIEHEQECAHREVGFCNWFPVARMATTAVVWLLREPHCACTISLRYRLCDQGNYFSNPLQPLERNIGMIPYSFRRRSNASTSAARIASNTGSWNATLRRRAVCVPWCAAPGAACLSLPKISRTTRHGKDLVGLVLADMGLGREIIWWWWGWWGVCMCVCGYYCRRAVSHFQARFCLSRRYPFYCYLFLPLTVLFPSWGSIRPQKNRKRTKTTHSGK